MQQLIGDKKEARGRRGWCMVVGCCAGLFSAVFVFQKSYTGNILEIGRNQSQTSRYSQELPEHRRRDGEEPLVGHTTRGAAWG
jgi:hypothetical protein